MVDVTCIVPVQGKQHSTVGPPICQGSVRLMGDMLPSSCLAVSGNTNLANELINLTGREFPAHKAANTRLNPPVMIHSDLDSVELRYCVVGSYANAENEPSDQAAWRRTESGFGAQDA